VSKYINRLENEFNICGEFFNIVDVLSVVPEYDKSEARNHYYDGKRHYISDGITQIGCELPYAIGDKILNALVEMRMCKTQRQMDEVYLRNLHSIRR
jgi:hypothetical protein